MTFVKGQKAWNKKEDIKLYCRYCRKVYFTKAAWNKPGRVSLYCSVKCGNTVKAQNRPIGVDNPVYKTGIQIYRRFKKAKCERCDNIDNLIVHHKDRNRHNNLISNLETLCRSCHAKEHNHITNLYPFSLKRSPTDSSS